MIKYPMKNLFLLFLLSLSTLYAGSKLDVVRFDQAKESWLAGDTEKTLEILLQIETSGNTSPANLYNIGYL